MWWPHMPTTLRKTGSPRGSSWPGSRTKATRKRGEWDVPEAKVIYLGLEGLHVCVLVCVCWCVCVYCGVALLETMLGSLAAPQYC